MRNLNNKQKKYITQWFNESWKGAGSVYTIDQMPIEMQDKLQSMNDHETLWQNADRFIGDMATKKVYGGE
jgi:hypothetical protein